MKKIKNITIVSLALFVLIATPRTFVSAITVYSSNVGNRSNPTLVDPELERLRKEEAIKNANTEVDSKKKDLRELGIYSSTYTQCGEPPIVNEQNIATTYRKWISCINPILSPEQKIKTAERALKRAITSVEASEEDIKSSVRRECRNAPTVPETRTSSEVEKFEIKSRLWIECSTKASDDALKKSQEALDQARRDINKSKEELLADVAYIQNKAQEYRIGGKLSDFCSDTTKFLSMSREQLSSQDILDVHKWRECAKRQVNTLVKNAKVELGSQKEIETRNIQKKWEDALKNVQIVNTQEVEVKQLIPKKEKIPEKIATSGPEAVKLTASSTEPVTIKESQSAIQKMIRKFRGFFGFRRKE